MMEERKPPIVLQPISSQLDQSKAAAFVFVHGLGDEAEGVESAWSAAQEPFRY
jgi:lysophospholipase-1